MTMNLAIPNPVATAPGSVFVDPRCEWAQSQIIILSTGRSHWYRRKSEQGLLGDFEMGHKKRQFYKPFSVSIIYACLLFTAAAKAPPSPVFYKTQDSDEWVRRTLHIQRRYSRVLLVDGAAGHAESVRVNSLELNTRNAPPGVGVLYHVNAVYKSLQEAADAARGGDLIGVMPGTYAGFVMGDKPDARDGSYIHFKALGKPGDCIINGPSSRDPDWMILLQPAPPFPFSLTTLSSIMKFTPRPSGKLFAPNFSVASLTRPRAHARVGSSFG